MSSANLQIKGETEIDESSSEFSVPLQSNSQTDKPGSQAKTKQGRPRDESAHKAILECTKFLAMQGLSYRDISFEAISREAKVAKTTLYRWWENKAELVREACFLEKIQCPDTGTLQGDLEDLVRQEIHAQTGSTSRPVFAALIAELVAHSDEKASEVPCPYQVERTDMIELVFKQARARGDWSGGIEIERAFETLFAMVFYPCIGRGREYDDAEVTLLAKRIMAEAEPRR